MRRTPLLLAAGSLLLAGCGPAAAPAAAPAAEVAPAAATEDAPALADGLLPADRFAPGATVTPVTADDLTAALGYAAAQDAGDVTVTPQACADAVDTLRAALGSPSGVAGAAGQYARTGFGGTAELLAEGGPADTAVEAVTAAVAACPVATVTGDRGSAQVAFGPVSTPALGEAAVVVPVTVTLTVDGRPGPSGSGLLGLVSDEDRLLALATGSLGTGSDPAAFGTLLEAAVAHATDTLG